MPGEPKIKAAVILGFADNVNQWRGCFGPSPALYERLRSANVAALLELRDEIAAEAAATGLTEERLAELLNDDGA